MPGSSPHPDDDAGPLTTTIEDGVAVLHFDDGKANVLSHAAIDAFEAALDRAADEARAVCIVGREGKLCAGFDLSVMTGEPDGARQLVSRGAALLMRLYLHPQPVVVAVTGHALAAGALLALTCDVRIGADVPAKIGLNETSIGMPLPQFAIELARDRLDAHGVRAGHARRRDLRPRGRRGGGLPRPGRPGRRGRGGGHRRGKPTERLPGRGLRSDQGGPAPGNRRPGAGWNRRRPGPVHRRGANRDPERPRTAPARRPEESHMADVASCSHMDRAPDVTPSADGCEDCLRIGGTWVHLRVCQSCGHTGCCDNSPNRHATAHFGSTPTTRSCGRSSRRELVVVLRRQRRPSTSRVRRRRRPTPDVTTDLATAVAGPSTQRRTVLGTCHHDCPDSCGWVVTVEDEPEDPSSGPTAVRLRGNPDHPYSRGELCPKVNRFLDRVYSPTASSARWCGARNSGNKGRADFAPASWDEALALVAERLGEIVHRYGGEAVLPWWSAGTQGLIHQSSLDRRFFAKLGASA